MPSETLILHAGFGPLQETTRLTLAPMTIFFGPQGSGKSLVSQVLYFFRDARYLLSRYGKEASVAPRVRQVVEGVRTGDAPTRALTAFLSGTTRVEYVHDSTRWRLSFRPKTREIEPLKPFATTIEQWLDEWKHDPQQRPRHRTALFIPAERVLISRFVNTDSAQLGHAVIPYTMREFVFFLQTSAEQWLTKPDLFPHQSRSNIIREWMQDVLGGYETYEKRGRFAGRWQWKMNGQKPIEIEMASSGQMEVWPIVFTARILAASQGPDDENMPRFLHIEEPEAHLHPRAQVRLAWILAWLVNRGFHLTVTTHSLTLLYAINNLILAHESLATLPLPYRCSTTSPLLALARERACLCVRQWAYHLGDERRRRDCGIAARRNTWKLGRSVLRTLGTCNDKRIGRRVVSMRSMPTVCEFTRHTVGLCVIPAKKLKDRADQHCTLRAPDTRAVSVVVAGHLRRRLLSWKTILRRLGVMP